MNVEERLSNHIHSFIELKRLWLTAQETIKICSEKEIKNDLLYFQILFTSIDGLVLRLCNFVSETYQILDQIASNRPKEFAFSRVKGHLKKLKPSNDTWLRDHSLKNLQETYEKWFPSVTEGRRKKFLWFKIKIAEYPIKQDFEMIKKNIEIKIRPIKSHRDTVVAHKDKKPKAADSKDMDEAIKFIEELLGDLYFIHSFGSYSFEFGGIAADPKDTAIEFAELIIKNKYERDEEVLQSRGIK